MKANPQLLGMVVALTGMCCAAMGMQGGLMTYLAFVLAGASGLYTALSVDKP